MESIESIASVIFQKTFSRVVIQSENKLKFNFQGHCTLTFHVQMSACVFRSKECVNNTSVMKCLELNFWLLVCKWQKIIQDALSFSFACHDNCKSMNSQNARAFKRAARHVQELCNSFSDTSWKRDLQTQHRTTLY